MNYYSHHIGDYLTDTAHLSILEDGAYRRLMDRYYATEQPLSNDESVLFRLLRARSEDEKEAVRIVLNEFFTTSSDGWKHKRCDQEIAAYREKSNKSADAANKRWNKLSSAPEMPTQCDSNANAMPTQCERIPDAMPTNNQEPIPITNIDKPAPKPRISKKTAIPENFEVTERVWNWAQERGYDRLDDRMDHFASVCRAKGYTYVDWDDAFMGAIRDNWAKFQAPKNKGVCL